MVETMTPEQASQKYHWCKYDKDTKTVELYLDNYMLSGLRTCESMFYLKHLLHVEPRYQEQGVRDDGKVSRKPWFFDFGEFVHYCLEQFYDHFRIHKIAPPIDYWLDICKAMWFSMKMDDYKNSISDADVKKYEEVKGWEGVAGLLCQYYAFYMDMRLRVIDTEITFGHNKEVNIGDFACHVGGGMDNAFNTRVECYLTGRIDLLVDNGYKIGPVDHKTTHKFDGFEHKDFNPHDAMTGYIYATHEIIKKYINDPIIGDKVHGYSGLHPSMGGWIFHISACTPSTPRDKTKKQGPRFKTTPVDKTLTQFDDYKARQLSTFKRVAELLFNNKTPEWNTNQCHNMFFRDCEYVPIHEQPSEQWQSIIDRFYTIGEGWDTREHSNKDTKTKEESNTGESISKL